MDWLPPQGLFHLRDSLYLFWGYEKTPCLAEYGEVGVFQVICHNSYVSPKGGMVRQLISELTVPISPFLFSSLGHLDTSSLSFVHLMVNCL